MGARTYDDTALVAAVASARSWRDVLRRLGLSATSASAIRSVRAHANRLQLDHSHFTGQRRWTDAQLVEAIARSHTWIEVLTHLGLAGGSSTSIVRAHALRMGIDVSHLTRRDEDPPGAVTLTPDAENLPRAGSMIAATWLAMSGLDVSWPLEPCRYDLLALRADVGTIRVQVKTTRTQSGGSWVVMLSSYRRGTRRIYDPDDIDYFFVVDGDLACYLIPIAAVGGLTAVSLSAYQQYRLPPLAFTGGSTG